MSLKSSIVACGLLLAGLHTTSAQGDYFEWAAGNGLIGVLAEPDADLDTDGITNLMAYAFDLSPLSDPEAWEKLPTLAFIGDPPEPIMVFLLPPEIPRDVSYVVELITDDGGKVELARKNGRGAWSGSGEITRRKLDDGCTEVTVQIPLEMEVPDGNQPLRLRVEFLP
jgi:hypothetical protein